MDELMTETPPEVPPMGMMEEPAPVPTSAATAGSAPETVNLVATIPEDILIKYGNDVFRKYERDLQSSTEYRKRRANIIKLFVGIMPPKDADSLSMAEVHYPIVAVAVQRIHARIYDQQFPSNGEYFGVKPTDGNDLERSVRVAKHLNWQTLHQIKEYVPNHDALIMQWLLYGSAFSVFYWNPVGNRPCHEVCLTEDIVLPYEASAGMAALRDPHLSSVARITRVLRKHRHELEEIAATGYYDALQVASLYAEDDEDENAKRTQEAPPTADEPVKEVTDQIEGQEKPGDGSDEDSPRILLEQHHWCKLPGETKLRPVITTIDKLTKKVIGLVIREDEDPVDKARYNREKAANKASYQAAVAQWQMDMAAYFGQQPMMTPPPMAGDPMATQPPTPGDPTVTVPPMDGAQTMTQPPAPGPTDATMPMQAPQMPVPPPMPQMPPEPASPRMVPINFFTHYICIPNPEGIYGLGIGTLLEGHNMVADTIASQIVDAGTLANTSTFLYPKQAKLKRGELKIRPGSGTEVDLLPQDMKHAIFPVVFNPPNPALAEFIKDQKEEAQELSGANEILSGEVGGSNETATTTQIRISQALAAIAILNKRYTRARTAEAENLARLNAVYLTDAEYFCVVDPVNPQDIQENEVARIDYLQDCHITVTADPRMASQPQRVAEAQTALQAVMASPVTGNDPIMIATAQRRLFIAMDMPDLVAGLDGTMMRLAQGMVPMGGQPPGGGQPANGAPEGPKGPGVPMEGPPTGESSSQPMQQGA